MRAAFYRNTLIHAFLETSIVELALAHAAGRRRDRVAAFWSQAMRLRDLLKFDFASRIRPRSVRMSPKRWRGTRIGRSTSPRATMRWGLLRAKRPLIAHAMLRPFFEAYEIVADVLCDAPAEISDADLTQRALGVGAQYAAQGKVRSNDRCRHCCLRPRGRWPPISNC